jgi:hypothetical protein
VQISQTADNGPLVQADSWREEYYQGGALALKQLVAPGRPGLVHDPKDRGVLGRTWSVLSGLRLVLTENYSWRTIASRYQWSKLSSGRLRRNCLVAEVGPKIVDSMTKARVYIDANILKFPATSLLRFRPREVMVDWGGKRQPLTVHDPVTVNLMAGSLIIQSLGEKRSFLLRWQPSPLAESLIFSLTLRLKWKSGDCPISTVRPAAFTELPTHLSRHRFSTVESCLAATMTTKKNSSISCARSGMSGLASCNASLVPTKAKQRSTETNSLMRFIYGVQSTRPSS